MEVFSREYTFRFIFLVTLKQTTIQVRDVFPFFQQILVPTIFTKQGCTLSRFRIQDTEEQRFKDGIQIIVLIPRAFKEILHVVQVATHPSLALQEMKEGDTSHHLLDIVAYLLFIVAESLHQLCVRIAQFLFFPFASYLHETLAGNILDKVGILFAILVEELIGQGFDRESRFQILERNAFLLQVMEAFNRCLIKQVITTKHIGISFRRSCFSLDVADEGQTPMVATIEYNQGCIELIAKKRLYQITKPYTLVGYRTLTDAIMEKTDTEIIGRINASQVITFIFGMSVKDSFGYLLQLMRLEEVQKESVPFGQVERRLEKVSQGIGCVGSSHNDIK